MASGRVPSCQQQIGWEIKAEKYTQTTERQAVSTQHLLCCSVFQLIYFCDFLPAKKSVSVKCCCFPPWPEDAEMHCSYSGLWIYVPLPDAEESTALNDEEAASATLPIKKLIVCPSRKGNDPLGFSVQLKFNCFWLCLCENRTLLCQFFFFSPLLEVCSHLWHLTQKSEVYKV